MTIEQWRPVSIPQYSHLYLVSDHGRVWVHGRDVYCGHPGAAPIRRPGHFLKPNPVGRQRTHLSVALTADGQCRHFKVHRLVMGAFVGPCPEGLEVLHWDDNPRNNKLTNLRYGTRSQNVKDQVRNGIHHLARRTHCIHGHEFTPENTYRAPGSPTKRHCKACWKARKSSNRNTTTTQWKGSTSVTRY
ncbi:HNH endonuclease signature motif containing protein [Mycobacteroides franklinii]|uniref:HNH endonuclease signature motif containing protein n=1 Tax=Mycobacteroides franklinii TaxID=948102 RepID=UPI0009933A2D|nr:HNH endonuclease signature motif containing protein [Mycobacteroides franklinii]